MSEMNETNNRRGLLLTLPFLLALAVLTVISFCIPLRPTISTSEKRELTKFPEFTVESLLSGDYFDDITLWFSDTFPGREDWLSLSQSVSSFHGYSEIAVEGDLTMSDEIPVETEPATEPQPEVTEQTEAAEETEPTGETTEATEPAETGWSGVQTENNEISLGAAIQIGDTGFNQLGFSKVQSDRYIKTVSKFADRMAKKGVRVISAPAPTAVGVMVEPDMLPQLKCARQDEMINYLHDNMSDNVIKVDTFSNLVKHNSEYIYFRTDHHWTQLGAYYAYEAMCEATGQEAAPLSSFTLWNQGTFTGSLYGKVRWPKKLRADTLDCYVPQGDITFYAHFTDGSKGTEWPLIAEKKGKANQNSRYSAFLAADCALAHVVNESIPDAPNCLVIKDSFGNCYVPFLTQNYHHVYAIDYRKYWRFGMADFVEKYNIDDVIVMPYLIATQAIDGNDMFRSQMH